MQTHDVFELFHSFDPADTVLLTLEDFQPTKFSAPEIEFANLILAGGNFQEAIQLEYSVQRGKLIPINSQLT
jgi:hypothetical protein